MSTKTATRSPRQGTGPEDERPGGRAAAPIVRRSAGRRRDLDRYAALMRTAGRLAGPPEPPTLMELARHRGVR